MSACFYPGRTASWNRHDTSRLFYPLTTANVHILGLLATEPILVLVTLYMSFCYGLLFLFIESYPIAFREVRGWSPQLTSLTFFGVIVGVGCGMLGVIVHALTLLAKKWPERRGTWFRNSACRP